MEANRKLKHYDAIDRTRVMRFRMFSLCYSRFTIAIARVRVARIRVTIKFIELNNNKLDSGNSGHGEHACVVTIE